MSDCICRVKVDKRVNDNNEVAKSFEVEVTFSRVRSQRR
jgi:hypothetical protein